MAITLVQGFQNSFGQYEGGGGITWADLGSSPYGTWSNWIAYKPVPENVIIRLDDDLTTVAARTPLLNVTFDGAITSIQLKISSSGAFTGEEQTINFAAGTNYDFDSGRYYRWTIEVEASNSTLPTISDATGVYSTVVATELINDYDIPAASVDSQDNTIVTDNIGKVLNVQATTLQGGVYVEEGYFIPAQTSTSVEGGQYLRNGYSVTNSTITAVQDQVKSGYYSFYWDSTDDFAVEGQDNFFNNTTPVTFETWIRWDNIPADTHTIVEIEDKDSSDGYNIPFVMTYLYSATPGTHNINVNIQGNIYSGGVDTGLNGTIILTSGVDPFVEDVWYHIAVTFDPSTLEGKLYIDGTLVSTDTGTAGFTIDTDNQSRMALGCAITAADGSFLGTTRFHGWMDNVRVSSSLIYTSAFTPPAQLYDRKDTLFLMEDVIQDEVLADLGTDAYIIRQRGGNAVVESKNPLTVRVVDYEGNAWDGAVDLVVRGLPSITLSGEGVTTAT